MSRGNDRLILSSSNQKLNILDYALSNNEPTAKDARKILKAVLNDQLLAIDCLQKTIITKKATANYLLGNKKGLWGRFTNADEKRSEELKNLYLKLDALKTKFFLIDNKQINKVVQLTLFSDSDF